MAADGVRRVATGELTAAEVASIRALVWAAFDADDAYMDEPFTERDWDHALGGAHFILELNGEIVSHAAVVERRIRIGDVPLRAGYVEAVATTTGLQGRGYGSRVMTDATAWIRDRFELGALATHRHAFYGRLGWSTWRGQAFVEDPKGLERTPSEDGYLLVLRTPETPQLDGSAPIVCEWRDGDLW